MEVIGDANNSNKRTMKGSLGMTDLMREILVDIRLSFHAQRAWKERHGKELPAINAFGDSYKKVGVVWTQSIAVSDNKPWYTTTDYPPSVLDDCAVNLPNGDGVAFRNQKSARQALWWRIICTVPLVGNRRRWADELLGEHSSVLLVVSPPTQPWCRLSRDDSGSFWVEYNGRKQALA